MLYDRQARAWVASVGAEGQTVRRLNVEEFARRDGTVGSYDPTEWVQNARVGDPLVLWEQRFRYEGARDAQTWVFSRMDPEEIQLPRATELDLSRIRENVTKRKPFKIVYETMAEAATRLRGSVILLASQPYMVEMIGGKDSNIILLLSDRDGKRHTACLKDIPDLRSPPSRYISDDGNAAYLTRIPARVYQQGMNQENTYAKKAGTDQLQSVGRSTILRGLADEKILPFDSTLDKLIREGHIPNIRLSNSIALFQDENNTIAEYRGRDLGVVKEDTVKLEFGDDSNCPWILEALKEVKLNARS